MPRFACGVRAPHAGGEVYGAALQTATPTTPDQHHRLPAEIISHGVWLYCRGWLSEREVAERRFARGLRVTYEAIRKWCVTVGQQ